MGLFSRSAASNNRSVDVSMPFTFRVEDVFTITGRGRLFTGVVESGAVPAGAPATLVVGDRSVPAQITRLESRKQRHPVVFNTGDTGAIGLDGIDSNDLPLRVHGGQMIVDSDALKGAVIRSRLASDAPSTPEPVQTRS